MKPFRKWLNERVVDVHGKKFVVSAGDTSSFMADAIGKLEEALGILAYPNKEGEAKNLIAQAKDVLKEAGSEHYKTLEVMLSRWDSPEYYSKSHILGSAIKSLKKPVPLSRSWV